MDHRDMIGRAFRDVVKSVGLDPDSEEYRIMSITVTSHSTTVEVVDVPIHWSVDEGIVPTRIVEGPAIPYNWKVE